MSSSLSITSAVPDPALLDLPWDLPLETWSDETIAALPKGISRHLVRFVHLEGYIVAVKETTADLIVIPRWRSRSSESVCVVPSSTLPGSSMTPAAWRSRSVRLVLPASTCATIPRLRLRGADSTVLHVLCIAGGDLLLG